MSFGPSLGALVRRHMETQMPPLRIVALETLPPEKALFWKQRIQHRYFAEASLDWTEAHRAGQHPRFRVAYLEVWDGETPLALAVFHSLTRFDLAPYMGGVVSRFLTWIGGTFGIRPLLTDLAFVEVPMSNVPGLQFAKGAEHRGREIGQAVLEYLRATEKYQMLLFKVQPEDAGDDQLASLGLLTTPFLPNMRLSLAPYRSFDDYYKMRSSKRRSEIRDFKETFREAGGTIEMVEDFGPHLDRIIELLHQTTEDHRRRNKFPPTIPDKREFFEYCLNQIPVPKRRAFLARIGSEIVAYSFCFESGQELMLSHCGLDSPKTLPTRTYFNLYYAMIEHAISRGYKNFDMGAEAYTFKRKMGGREVATTYHFEVKSPFLGFIAKLASRFFASKDGVAKTA